jgi:hypothetical protein
MMRAGLLFFLAGFLAALPAVAQPCPAGKGEAACMLEAAWQAAEALPEGKRDRVLEAFVTPVSYLTPAEARTVWKSRLRNVGVTIAGPDYVRETAETVIRENGWQGFLQRARDGAAPLHMGRPEIMAAAVDLAPNAGERRKLIDLMVQLAGASDSRKVSGIPLDSFERADFGHVLAERAMRDCDLAAFDRAASLTTAPDALRYRLWRARITGGAGSLADAIREGDGSTDTRHVRQALEGYGAILALGYCAR